MFDEIIKSMQVCDRAKHRKATKDIQTNVILETLDAHKTLPLANKFKPGELVTQLITSIDPADGEPNRRYSFPLPGQPARVVAMIENPTFDSESSGNANGYDDLLIEAVTPCGPDKKGVEVREYLVSSRFFRTWENGETIPQALVDFIDKKAAAAESKED